MGVPVQGEVTVAGVPAVSAMGNLFFGSGRGVGGWLVEDTGLLASREI